MAKKERAAADLAIDTNPTQDNPTQGAGTQPTDNSGSSNPDDKQKDEDDSQVAGNEKTIELENENITLKYMIEAKDQAISVLQRQITLSAVLEDTKRTVVLVGVGAASELIEASVSMWRNRFPGCDEIVVLGQDIDLVYESEDADQRVVEALAAAIASDMVSDEFIFAPVGTLPISDLSKSEFEVICDFDGFYGSIYPRLLDKETVAECIMDCPPDKVVKVAQRYGNYVPFPLPKMNTVVNSNPDRSQVQKALAENKYLYIKNVEGFIKIKDLLL